jgi:hypothetical protein
MAVYHYMSPSRTIVFAALLCLPACASCAPSTEQQAPPAETQALPQGPQPASAGDATLSGTVEDGDGGLLPGARVEVTCAGNTQVEISDSDGGFHLYGLPAGGCNVRVSDSGYAADVVHVSLEAGQQEQMQPIELRPVGDHSTITVMATEHEIATVQLEEEMHQRVFGIIPNFYVVYHPNPAPLSAGQKLHLAWRSLLDPITFLGTGISAGIEQATGSFSGWGFDHKGYFQRYGANYADNSVATMLGGFIFPTILKQDPRYFYQGTGTTVSRAKHAMLSVIICRGDNGKQQFNYSNVLGDFGGAAISNIYYPPANRNGVGLTMGNAAVGLAFGAFGALMQEFVVPRFTPNRPGKKIVNVASTQQAASSLFR